MTHDIEAARASARALGPVLRARGATLVTAESCTGGLIGALVTEVAGSSDYYLGGVVAYANASKTLWLGVRPDVLATHGAVSGAVARAMAAGARDAAGATWAVAVTGIAGPGGGAPGRPVGLVYIGLAGPAGTESRRHLFAGDRAAVRCAAAAAALGLVLRAVEGGAPSRKPGRS